MSKSKYIAVTKPGIIFGNIITVSGGYFFGALGIISVWAYIAVIIGMSLVMASGCVLNNLIDRDIDSLMQRTKERELVTGKITPTMAVIYALILGILGLCILYFFNNPLTALVAVIGIIIYVVIYSLYAKRYSRFGTEIGAIAGAIPPIVGYTAAANSLDLGALAIFLVLFFWQLPHSYAIAINRLNDYRAASIPVLPDRVNMHTTKILMLVFTLAYTIATLLPSFFGYTGYFYLIIELILGLMWITVCIKGFKADDNKAWAKKMFITSILMIMGFSIFISLAASFHF